MREQLHKRMPLETVSRILEAFTEHKISEKQACEILGIARTRLYELRACWLQQGEHFQLSAGRELRGSVIHPGIKEFLLKEFKFIRNEAEHSRGKFNFALLSEEVNKRFNHFLHRNTIRRLAIRAGHYKPIPGKKPRVYRRFEMGAPGMLLQHDTSIHNWIPYLSTKQSLILTKDDYSRMFLGGVIVPVETSWDHIVLVRETVLKYGIPMAYYVDNDSAFTYIRYSGDYVREVRKSEAEYFL